MKPFLRSVAALLAAIILSSCGSRLVVTSTPPGSRVRVNNADYGATPMRLENLQPGVYDVQVTQDGFETWRSEIELNTSQTLHAILRQKTSAPPLPPPLPPIARTRLSVFAEPAGSTVIVDGRNRGVARAGEPILVDYEQSPTLSEIVVEKAGFNRWIRSVAMEGQRDNRVFVKLAPVSNWYDYVTDGEFLRRTVQQVVASSSNLPSLRRGARLSVLSITHAEGSDEPLQAVVEDALVSALAQAGFSPAERDDQMLVQLAHSTSGDSLPYRVLTQHRGFEDPFLYDAEIVTTRTEEVREEYPIVNRSTSITRSNQNCREATEERTTSREERGVMTYDRTTFVLEGNIPTADQFLAYRILECGLSKTPVVEGNPRPEPTLHRYASLRVHVRVIDAKSGIVTWAGYLTGESADEIPERVSADLSNPPTRFTSEPLPDSWQRLRHGTRRHRNLEEPAGASRVESVENLAAPSPRLR